MKTGTLKRYARSARAFRQAKTYLAGGVSSMMRASAKPLPLFFQAADGVMLTDYDDHLYIDYALGWGPLILGHSHPAIVEAVQHQLEKFQLLGAQHELEVQVARKICEMLPCAELVAFSNTGSEAVQLALRLARAFTGRRKFIKFEGHYHGWFDNILLSYHPNGQQLRSRRPVPVSEGQSLSGLGEVYVLPWNDPAALDRVLSEHHKEIAGIITEPILCNSSCLMPRPGYLSRMRELSKRYGVVLIFDEVITGFRVSPGGAQQAMGVTPDLAILGKAIAAGFPLSAVAGRREIMDLIPQRRVVHAGTFNGNPIALAAARAGLEVLSARRGAALKKVQSLGEKLIAGITACAAEAGIPCLINGTGSAFHVSFTSRKTMHNYRDTLDCDQEARDRFLRAMLEHGVYLIPDGRWYLSTAHTQEHVDATLDAVRKAFSTFRPLKLKSD